MAQSRSEAGTTHTSLFVEILEALADKHAQLDINLEGMGVRIPSVGTSVEFNGHVTVAFHMRDMTDDEKRAAASKNVAMMAR
jgi:hypothetical protein